MKTRTFFTLLVVIVSSGVAAAIVLKELILRGWM